MSYVDGYVLPVPKKHVKTYRRMAEMGRDAWMKHGALDYKECVGDLWADMRKHRYSLRAKRKRIQAEATTPRSS